MPDDDDYRRQMDDKIIGFLAAHEVWMTNDTAWKKETSNEMKAIKSRVSNLERWKSYLTGAWAVLTAAFAWMCSWGNK